jgi:Transcriptional regulator, AbiEi antitoxin
MRPPDGMVRRIGAIATAQKGLATRAQLLDAGLSDAAIKRRVRSGVLLVEFPGVYRVGHRAPNVEARYLAAILACGPGALLAGRAAGHLHGLLKQPPSMPVVIAATKRRISGIRARRGRSMHPRDASTKSGIPVTSVPRTLVDLAAELTEAELARACHEAGVKYRTTPRQVEEVLARRRGTAGAGKLRRVMTGDAKVTLSKMESRFLNVLRAHDLPLPITNRVASARRVDCRWPEHRLTVELDSYRFHNTRHAWEQDRRREREAHARGDQFRRYTYGDVFEGPEPMLKELRPLLPNTGQRRGG